MKLQDSDIIAEREVGRVVPLQVTAPMAWVTCNHIRRGNRIVIYRKLMNGRDVLILEVKKR